MLFKPKGNFYKVRSRVIYMPTGHFFRTPEHRQHIAESKKGKKRPQYVIDAIIKANKERVVSQETKDKIGLANSGLVRSEELKSKWSQIKLNESLKTCPFCGLEGRGNVMYVYHFENCKQNPNYIEPEILTCPHCGFQSRSKSNMKGYHFDNCRFKVEQDETYIRKAFGYQTTN